jgi:error-prone DNA polymerase
VHTASELKALKHGRMIRIAGIVTHRQRPETAKEVMFISLEDETGISNVVVWKGVQLSQREAVLGATLMVVQGQLQIENNVVHIVAHKVRDYSHWLGELAVNSRDFR